MHYHNLCTVLGVYITVEQHIIVSELEVSAEPVGTYAERIHIGMPCQRVITLIVTVHLIACGNGIAYVPPDGVIGLIPTVVPVLIQRCLKISYHTELGLNLGHEHLQFLTGQVQRRLNA